MYGQCVKFVMLNTQTHTHNTRQTRFTNMHKIEHRMKQRSLQKNLIRQRNFIDLHKNQINLCEYVCVCVETFCVSSNTSRNAKPERYSVCAFSIFYMNWVTHCRNKIRFNIYLYQCFFYGDNCQRGKNSNLQHTNLRMRVSEEGNQYLWDLSCAWHVVTKMSHL